MKLILSAFAFTICAASIASAAPELCQFRINGQNMQAAIGTDSNGQGFFSYVATSSQKDQACYYAKINREEGSGRVYNNGQLVPSASGQKKGLTGSEAKEAMSRTGRSCTTVSCIPLVYNDKPQYEQPVQRPQTPQAPTYPQSQSAD
jgi:hypothetical protein